MIIYGIKVKSYNRGNSGLCARCKILNGVYIPNSVSTPLWTHWSLIRELRADFASLQRDDTLTLNWRDTWRYAFGANYQSESNKWALRSGFAYDQSPVSGAQFRSPRIPDGNRYWLTFGFTYALSQKIHVHGAYAHLFVDDLAINKQGVSADTLVGHYSEQFNIGGLQLDWRF